jgi:FAD:protein FMN transferase
VIGLVELSRTFRAMSTGIEAIVCVPEAQRSEAELALSRVQYLFAETENRLSRFRTESELSRLNQSAGQQFAASPLLYEIIAEAVSSAQLTGGIFDPTILHYLISAGYDRSFELLNIPRKTSIPDPNPARHTWRDIWLDPPALSIYLPEGCSLDLGGIAKGWTVDRAGRYLDKFQNYAVNAGGDIFVKGTQTDDSPWTVGIEDPLNRKSEIGVLSLSGVAICTSTTTQRHWQINHLRKHHLIDPRTGLPSDSGVISATVIAGTAALAETISKAALILGPQGGLQLIEKQKPARGMLVLDDGRCLTSSGFRKLTRAGKMGWRTRLTGH